ncbi:outer membrane protein assembly factor BamA [Elysia marginata]|uniref:Outer membrane protein assembly factor BamA n=1 Tax=Elysia marginata TaxID=1093978 RepID=A0AAV4GJD6_9GAST|nr:outer membrane protein assembly factor BamA [Elysia marginata]
MKFSHLFFDLGVVLVGLFFNTTLAQENFVEGKRYYIDSIEVKGVRSYSPQAVISYSGLQRGRVISLPGEEITEGIKKLWGLKLFSDVNIYISKINGKSASLVIEIEELPNLIDYKILGVRKKMKQDIEKDVGLKKGLKVNQNFIATTEQFILKKFREKGFFDTKVHINSKENDTQKNGIRMIIRVDRGPRVKVQKINILNNEKFSDAFVKRAMKNTKQRRFYRLKKSKYVEKEFREDLLAIIDKYKENGYRDARIVGDSISRKGEDIQIDITVQEGNKYHFGDIDFIGNAAYSDWQLSRVLGINKGDTYNGVLLKKRIADDKKPDGNNITNLYQNNGYLFSSIRPVETTIKNDTINMEIRIIEGKQAYFKRINVVGNERTNDHVIYRELRTRPGDLYSKQNVIRTVRELSQLQFFDPEQIKPNFKNTDPNTGVLDLEYSLAEKGGSQIQLQGGYGGGGFIGTLALAFNNFSIKDIFKGKAYRPLPLGDGQNFSLRLQASQFFRTYSVNFSEPWLNGKKPVSFSVSISHTEQFLSNPLNFSVDTSRRFFITGITIGLAKRLKFPDDYFSLSQAISFQHYKLDDYNTRLFTFGNGFSNSLSYTIVLSRNSSGPNPIYPLQGSNILISGEVSPPYSLLSGIDYKNLSQIEAYKRKDSQGFYIDSRGKRVDRFQDAVADVGKVDQERFKVLEFYKIKFKSNWYATLIGKLVLRIGAEFGALGFYNSGIGLIPFERFFIGGSGLTTRTLDGRENIQLRGYPNRSLSGQDGSAVYNKFVSELRYPITLSPTASIYGLVFLEAGKGYNDISTLAPFQLKRSAGFGVRIFMPAFGLIGFDFGRGFDPIGDSGPISGWQTHFLIGQQF